MKKLKCPACNKPVPTYTVNGKIHCAICNTYIMDDDTDTGAVASNETIGHVIPPSPNEPEGDCPVEEYPAHSRKVRHQKKTTKKRAKDTVSEDAALDQSQSPAFDVNKDGFYNDVPPEILSEIEHLPKEIFLKIFAGVLGIVGSIIFLIFYF